MYFVLQSCFLPSLKNNVVYVANIHNIYHTEIFTLNQCKYKQTEIDLHIFFVKSTCVCVVQSGLSNQLPIEYNSNHWHYIYIGRYVQYIASTTFDLVVCVWRVWYIWYKECNQWYRQEQNYVRNKFSRLEVVLLCLRNITQCHEALCIVMGFSSFFWL